MRKGFMRIVEALIVLMLMFTLMTALVKQNPSIQHAKNIQILQRYSLDASNMVCNSERARGIVMTPAAMVWINSSLRYSLPENLRYNVIVNNQAGNLIKSTGYTMPEGYQNLATSSCTVSRWGDPPREVVVRVWR